MNYNDFAKQIIELKNADLALRKLLIQKGILHDGYNRQMAALHNRNASTLNEIIDKIGYPTTDKVGREANEASWLIIQHAIEQPQFMKRCLQLLESAVKEKKGSAVDLAYLSDRIAVFEGRPQLFGTQFDWDANKELSPNCYDDLASVNERRKSIGLNTLEVQTQIIRKRAQEEGQLPPEDFEKRTQETRAWKIRVGWITAG